MESAAKMTTDNGSDRLISVTIVCYNGARDIRRCLQSLREQTWPQVEVVVIDNASKDDSVAILAEFPEVRLVVNPVNTGFSVAQNQAIREARGPWIVSLNLDTRAEPAFLEEMWNAMQADPLVGTVCPKILRMERDGTHATPALIDSTGCYATLQMRHHNRGSQEQDLGQYDHPEYVFGYTGAAAMFRRTMLNDVAVDGWFLDEDFFAYREDSDLSWRAQLYGWRCLYTPYAVIYHQRHVFEHNRAKVSALINMHSTKNRFLLRINNVTPKVYAKSLLATTWRDLGVVVYCLLKERTSIPGLLFLWRERKRLFQKRRTIQRRRKVSDDFLCTWFASQPISMQISQEVLARLDETRRTPARSKALAQ